MNYYIILNETEDKVLSSVGSWVEATNANKYKQALQSEHNANKRLNNQIDFIKKEIMFWSKEHNLTGDTTPRDPKDIVIELNNKLKVLNNAKVVIIQ